MLKLEFPPILQVYGPRLLPTYLLLGRVRKDETPDEEKSSDILSCKKNLQVIIEDCFGNLVEDYSVTFIKIYIIVLFIFHILMQLVS